VPHIKYILCSGPMKQIYLHMVANGHTAIDFNEYDSLEWFRAVAFLEEELGFSSAGKVVMGPGESILPSFVKDDISIRAGYDNWSGNYLLSESAKGDELLKSLYSNLFESKS